MTNIFIKLNSNAPVFTIKINVVDKISVKLLAFYIAELSYLFQSA